MEKGRTGSAWDGAERPKRAAWFRTIAARLLVALAVLALPVAPLAAACAGGGYDRHHAASSSDCDPAGLAAEAPPSHEQGHQEGDGHHAPAPAACCLASACPALLGALPPATARAPPPAHPSGAAPAAGPRLDGLDVPPALPPPRVAA